MELKLSDGFKATYNKDALIALSNIVNKIITYIYNKHTDMTFESLLITHSESFSSLVGKEILTETEIKVIKISVNKFVSEMLKKGLKVRLPLNVNVTEIPSATEVTTEMIEHISNVELMLESTLSILTNRLSASTSQTT